MKILFLTAGKNAPSTRYRVLQFIEKLSEDGISSTIKYADEGNTKIARILNKIATLLTMDKYDIVFLQKPNYVLHRPLLQIFLKKKRKIIFDFDDAIFIDPETDNLRDKETLNKINEIIRISSAVITGNSFLESYTKQYNDNTYIIPTVIDTSKYYRYRIKENSVITIGWIGTKGNIKHLLMIKSILKRVLQRGNVRFMLVSNIGEKLFRQLFNGENMYYFDWVPSKELEYLNEFDIGLMPLNNNKYSWGKCGFKLIQYMSVEIPVIASPVGVNPEIVVDGVTGYLASNEEEWEEKLSLLIDNNDLRQEMGKAGRKRVEEKYSIDIAYPEMKNIIEKVSGSGESQ
jgi:glycosyltransferase involved in cell wall biosynthesis